MDPIAKKLAAIRGKELSREERQQRAVEVAALLIEQSRKKEHRSERKRGAQLAKLMADPKGKAFTTAITDQCFRSQANERVADQMVYLIRRFGLPTYLTRRERWKLQFFVKHAEHHAEQLIPIATRQLRKEMAAVILPGEGEALTHAIVHRQRKGLRVNLNHLGEAILGEEEAERQLQLYIDDLSRPEVDVISVKITSICSQINLIAYDETLELLASRLKRLYRSAKDKLVNLDMEEYRDLHLTVDLFRKVLSEDDFLNYTAGIALQAYIPDSYAVQQELTQWAKERAARGGAPIRIRIVKGANLAMERVEASIEGWPQAPYTTKEEVDANYKRMVTYGCDPANARTVHLGIASHNLFDIAYAMVLRAEHEVEPFVAFEMLEGMADSSMRVVHKATGEMLVYCPAAEAAAFHVAVAYLIRRLDENTAPENFLHHIFNLTVGSAAWYEEKERFERACERMDSISNEPRRTQDRYALPELSERPFRNEPPTDWSLPHHRKWAQGVVSEGLVRRPDWTSGSEEGFDPSRPGIPLYTYVSMGAKEVNRALARAKKSEREWATASPTDRAALLNQTANLLRRDRGRLLGIMMADGGKVIEEADHELCEAIDFLDFYAEQLLKLTNLEEVSWTPLGTILVTSPWNFPCAIPTGGVAAALVTGNCVLFKPAPEAVWIGWEIAQLFYEAGVPKDVLHFITCPEEGVGEDLIGDRRVDGVILTGSTETARLFRSLRPGLHLNAETGGKNAIIITDLADRDLAIESLVSSAFGHSGQKCSAASLAVCLPGVYDDPSFMATLRDAAHSLPVGSAWNLTTKVGPLIKPPSGPLLRGLTELEEGENWLLEPHGHPENPNLWSPGIKIGVQPNGFTHMTELFGPVLGVMRANNLDEACRLVNATQYGLTSGIQTLDPREQQRWIHRIEAGNLYINRSITGAIVQRQPFGGTKCSSFGEGHKAGGPNYLTQFMRAMPKSRPTKLAQPTYRVHSLQRWIDSISSEEERAIFHASLESYAYWWPNHRKLYDPAKLIGQDNIFRLVPHWRVTLRLRAADNPLDIARVCAAAIICRTQLEVSWDPESSPLMPEVWPAPLFLLEESEETFLGRIDSGEVVRVRVLSPSSDDLLASQAHVCDLPVQELGRIELLNYVREVVICTNYHRYGNLGIREDEPRSPVA